MEEIWKKKIIYANKRRKERRLVSELEALRAEIESLYHDISQVEQHE
jgi:hypothetical protein